MSTSSMATSTRSRISRSHRPQGERMVVCGPSGSGKSTLIRCFNGLEFHDSGVLTVDGVEVYRGRQATSRALRQDVGMVFQQFNLFPHLTVLENLTIGPMKVRKSCRGRGRGTGAQVPGAGAYSRTGRQIPGRPVRRSAAARGHCPVAVHGNPDHAVRRADLGARPRDDQRGARRDGRTWPTPA